MLNCFGVLHETLQSLILCNVLCKLSLGWLMPISGERCVRGAITTQTLNFSGWVSLFCCGGPFYYQRLLQKFKIVKTEVLI